MDWVEHMWKRLSKWSYEELEDELLRQPAREQLLLDEIKRRRKKEIEKNIWEAEKLDNQRRRRGAVKNFFISLAIAGLTCCFLVGIAAYKGVDVYAYAIAAAQAVAGAYGVVEQYAIDIYDFSRSLLDK